MATFSIGLVKKPRPAPPLLICLSSLGQVLRGSSLADKDISIPAPPRPPLNPFRLEKHGH